MGRIDIFISTYAYISTYIHIGRGAAEFVSFPRRSSQQLGWRFLTSSSPQNLSIAKMKGRWDK